MKSITAFAWTRPCAWLELRLGSKRSGSMPDGFNMSQGPRETHLEHQGHCASFRAGPVGPFCTRSSTSFKWQLKGGVLPLLCYSSSFTPNRGRDTNMNKGILPGGHKNSFRAICAWLSISFLLLSRRQNHDNYNGAFQMVLNLPHPQILTYLQQKGICFQQLSHPETVNTKPNLGMTRLKMLFTENKPNGRVNSRF